MNSEDEQLRKRFPLPEPMTIVYYYLQQQILKLDALQGVEAPTLGECEFVLIQELNAQLVQHLPYGDLIEIKDELGLTQEETTLSWHAINDFHATTVVLAHTPRTIAAAAISVVIAVRPSSGSSNLSHLNTTSVAERQGPEQTKQEKLATWLAKSQLSLEAVADCTQALVSLYTALEKYSDSVCKQQLMTLARARGIAGV
ncbi:MAG: hypothetical protein Q9159_005287 [Coniocarpon cinnabarinum]